MRCQTPLENLIFLTFEVFPTELFLKKFVNKSAFRVEQTRGQADISAFRAQRVKVEPVKVPLQFLF